MSLRKRASVSNTPHNFERFDAFTKPKEEIQMSTKTTRSISWMVSAFLSLVVLAEVYSFLQPNYTQDFTVDQDISVNNELKINLDVYMGMPCDDIAIDILDESDTLYRANGAFVKETYDFFISDEHGVEHNDDLKPDEAIKRAYKPARREVKGDKVRGCRVHGAINLPKLSGNLHLSPSGHLHAGKHADHDKMNLTHKIVNLNFGENYPGLVNPLNDVKKVAKGHFWNYRYYIHLVPTTYINSWGTNLKTYQYSVSEYDMEVSEENRRSPGIFFKYNIAEFQNTVRDSSKGFGGFLLRLCAIVGGVFSSTKMVFAVTTMVTGLKKPRTPTSKLD